MDDNAEFSALLRRARIRAIIHSALKNERSVVEWVEAIERRLGTDEEQHMDAVVIAFLMHRLANIQTVTSMADEYGVTGNTKPPFPIP